MRYASSVDWTGVMRRAERVASLRSRRTIVYGCGESAKYPSMYSTRISPAVAAATCGMYTNGPPSVYATKSAFVYAIRAAGSATVMPRALGSRVAAGVEFVEFEVPIFFFFLFLLFFFFYFFFLFLSAYSSGANKKKRANRGKAFQKKLKFMPGFWSSFFPSFLFYSIFFFFLKGRVWRIWRVFKSRPLKKGGVPLAGWGGRGRLLPKKPSISSITPTRPFLVTGGFGVRGPRIFDYQKKKRLYASTRAEKRAVSFSGF